MNYSYKYESTSFGRFGKIGKIVIAIILAIAATSLAYTGYLIYAQQNEPSVKFVSGTIYVAGERGQTIARINDRFGNPINNASCKATIIYPDKTFFVVDINMRESSVAGNYFYEFIVPQQLGLYEEIVKCAATPQGREVNMTVSSSFQVSKALTYVQNLSEQQIATLNDISVKLDSKIMSINQTLNARFSEISERINSTEANLTANVDTKFNKLYANLYNATQAMGAVFMQAASNST